MPVGLSRRSARPRGGRLFAVTAVAAGLALVLVGSLHRHPPRPDTHPAAAAAGPVRAPQSSQPPPPQRASGGRVTTLAVPGPTGTRPVWVWRPDVPDSAELPVLYFLHGVPGRPGDVFTAAGLAAVMTSWVRAGGRPFVVAAPDGNGRTHADTEWADAVDGSDEVEGYVTKDVLAAVEGTHPRDAAHRAVAGFSMGGYGAVNLALRHRDLFGQAASLAGYFHVDDPSGMFGSDPAAVAANSPDHELAAARGLRLYLADSDADDEPVIRGETQRFAALLARADVPATVSLTPGTHSWPWVASQLLAVAQFLAAGWSP